MNFFKHLEAMSEISGISGQEDIVRDYIKSQIDGYCDYKTDALGNLIAYKKGAKKPKNTMYMSAHMDEIGFIITNITDDGLLRFTNVGGVDSRVVFGKSVEVGQNKIPGVIAGKPIHLTEKDEETKPPSLDKLFIDIGANNKEEALEVVSLGDAVVFAGHIDNLGDNKIVGKAFDDRAGCALIIDLIQSDLPYDVTFGFTTQEEVGCIGGQVAAYTVNADICVALEATTASDIAGVEKDKHVCSQNKGAVISFMDRGTLYDKKLFNFILDTAKTHNIPCQPKLGVFGGNEARVMQSARSGSVVTAISLPTRYIHSAVNCIDKRDVSSMRDLLDVLIPAFAEVNLGE